LFINKAYRIGEVILFVNKAKNTGIATLWRVFLKKLTSKRTRLNVMFISEQTLKQELIAFIQKRINEKLKLKIKSKRGEVFVFR
jgi:hypothetical protein